LNPFSLFLSAFNIKTLFSFFHDFFSPINIDISVAIYLPSVQFKSIFCYFAEYLRREVAKEKVSSGVFLSYGTFHAISNNVIAVFAIRLLNVSHISRCAETSARPRSIFRLSRLNVTSDTFPRVKR